MPRGKPQITIRRINGTQFKVICSEEFDAGVFQELMSCVLYLTGRFHLFLEDDVIVSGTGEVVQKATKREYF